MLQFLWRSSIAIGWVTCAASPNNNHSCNRCHQHHSHMYEQLDMQIGILLWLRRGRMLRGTGAEGEGQRSRRGEGWECLDVWGVWACQGKVRGVGGKERLRRPAQEPAGDQPKNRRATNPRTGGRPTQELMGDHSWGCLAALCSSRATNPRTGGRPTQELAGAQPKN